METFYTGSIRIIMFPQDAVETLQMARSHVPTNKDSCVSQLFRVLKRLGDNDQIFNKNQFRHEGDGIYAVKARCGLRGYGWFQSLDSGVGAFVLSHFIMKKRLKLDEKDLRRAREARKKFGDDQ